MGSFLSSLSSTPPPPDNFMEMRPLPVSRSSEHRTGQVDRQANLDQFSGRRYPLNPNGHFTTNLFTGLRRRLRANANTPTNVNDEWVLEPLLTSTDHVLDVLEHKASAIYENNIDQPLNSKLSNLTAFNIDNRDRMIEKLRNDLKESNRQLRNARKEINTLKERLAKAANV